MSSARVLGRRQVHRGRVFRLEQEDVVLPGGREATFDVMRHPGAAAILPVDEEGRVLLIRQYRHALGREIWEIPAGTLEPGESPLACAQRELVEEAGVRAADFVDLGEFAPLAATSDEIIHLFLARDLAPAEQDLDEDEVISEVRAVSLAELSSDVAGGGLIDPKAMVAWLRAVARGYLAGPVENAPGS